MIEYRYGPELSLPNFNDAGLQEFLNSPGMTIEAPEKNTKSVYPNFIKNHAIVPIENLYSMESNDADASSKHGYLIEHLATGLLYFVYKAHDVTWQYDKKTKTHKSIYGTSDYTARGVVNFEGSKEEPKNIALIWDEYKRWISTDLDTMGTRIGGIPLNPDGTPYSGLWPYLKDGRVLSFLAQYELEDGRYVHLFVGHNFDEYNYQAPEYRSILDAYEDPFSCAIIEGCPVPLWIDMRPLDSENQPLVHANKAYKLKSFRKDLVPAPRWVQEEYVPGQGEFQFLTQIGDTYNLKDEMDFIDGDGGDLYLFVDLKSGIVKTIIQCD